MSMSATETQPLPVGSDVLVNGDLPGVIVEAEARDGAYAQWGRPFAAYLVRLADGSVEGFTGAYLTEVSA